jgi:predicted permease
VFQAIRQATTYLRRRPAFSCAVIFITALGVGSCTAVFSIFSAVLLERLPYADADRLGIIWHSQGTAPGVVGLSPSDYTTYRDSTQSFDAVAAATTRGYNIGGIGDPARVTCGRVTPSTFPMLGVAPATGRVITDADDRTGERVVVISDTLWHTHLGSSADIVGRLILLDAVPHTVIGVMPRSFVFPPAGVQGTTPADCWIPTSFTAAEHATPSFNFVVMAKLKPGVTFERAAPDAEAGARRIWESYPAAVQSQVQLRARLVPLTEQLTASGRPILLIFTAASGFLLLIGCANIANLILTTLHVRQREMDVRAALGATRGSLAKQLLAESVLLGLAGSLAGALLATGLLTAIVAMAPDNVPRLGQAQLDPAALIFAVGCAVVAAVLSGLAPTMRVRARAGSYVPAHVRTSTTRRDALRSTLVAVEIALAVAVLTMAAMLGRTVANLQGVEAGFDAGSVVTFSIALPPAQYQQADRIAAFTESIVEGLHQTPGTLRAAGGSGLPIGRAEVGVIAATDAAPGTPPFRPVAVHTVTPGYHSTFGITLQSGRALSNTDSMTATPVAVVSNGLATAQWPNANPIGQPLRRVGDPRTFTVVGVVADVRQSGLAREPVPTVYLPLAQSRQPIHALSFGVRSAGELSQLANAARRVVSELDGSLPVFAVRTADEMVQSSIAPQRFNMLIVIVFAVMALCLAVSGLYAVSAHVAAQSTREFGLRVALGATSARIATLVLGRAVRLLVVGLLLGAALSLGSSQLASSVLFGVQPGDSRAIVFAAFILTVVTAAVVGQLAWRASRVDPVACLRHE